MSIHRVALSCLVACVLSAAAAADTQSLPQESCASCGLRTPDQSERVNIDFLEAVKRHILNRMQMRERPNITHPIPKAAMVTALRRLHAGKVREDGRVEIPSFDGQAAYNNEVHTENSEIISFAESAGTEPGTAVVDLVWGVGARDRGHLPPALRVQACNPIQAFITDQWNKEDVGAMRHFKETNHSVLLVWVEGVEDVVSTQARAQIEPMVLKHQPFCLDEKSALVGATPAKPVTGPELDLTSCFSKLEPQTECSSWASVSPSVSLSFSHVVTDWSLTGLAGSSVSPGWLLVVTYG
ncbi:Inhibin beta B chain [Liparis tanakae]|uniref:Inhibin beta B chain n=1 Tax=Liparis tanakae TaxID=230148 RepID=A0A4Z2EZX9_9TELE|nr:Inhibin beta B chain [Liparis tanakae]